MEIKPYTADLEVAVHAFNQRLRARGEKRWRIPETHVQRFPKQDGRNPYQEFYLAWHDGQVRGGYLLTHSRFELRGETIPIACGPQWNITEGVVDPAYSMVGVIQVQDALRRQDLMYGLGMGGMNAPLTKLYTAMGWHSYPVPFHFKVRSTSQFLKNVAYLRNTKSRRILLDLLRCTGTGSLAIRMLQINFQNRRCELSAATVEEFGSWADVLWEEHKSSYSLSAVRNSATLNVLYPSQESRFLRLRVSRDGRDLGWTVMLDTQMSGHKQFGSMRVGSIVDCFGAPADAKDVVRSATEFLEARGVDITISNQASADWCKALTSNGYLKGPSNFILALSPKLTERLEPLHDYRPRIHINRGDGDGPINL